MSVDSEIKKWCLVYRRLHGGALCETYWNGTRQEAERYAHAMQFGEYSNVAVLLIEEWDKTYQPREFGAGVSGGKQTEGV